MTENATHYQAIVVGAGQAGAPLARHLAGAGWRTALVERAHVGGTCINEGCTPTKTMVASGRVAYLARRADDYGVRAGLTEEEARRQGRAVKVGKIAMEDIARASEVGETRGLLKVVVDAERGQILGCAALGIVGGELMAMIEIAMLGQLPYTALRDAIFAHPTLAEGLNALFYAID